MTLAAALKTIRELGWRGVMLWQLPGGEFNGALLNSRGEADHTTHCWQPQADPDEVLAQLVKKAGGRTG